MKNLATILALKSKLPRKFQLKQKIVKHFTRPKQQAA